MFLFYRHLLRNYVYNTPVSIYYFQQCQCSLPHFGTVEEISHVSTLSKVDNKYLPPMKSEVQKSEVGQASPFPSVTSTELAVTKEEQTKDIKVLRNI